MFWRRCTILVRSAGSASLASTGHNGRRLRVGLLVGSYMCREGCLDCDERRRCVMDCYESRSERRIVPYITLSQRPTKASISFVPMSYYRIASLDGTVVSINAGIFGSISYMPIAAETCEYESRSIDKERTIWCTITWLQSDTHTSSCGGNASGSSRKAQPSPRSTRAGVRGC